MSPYQAEDIRLKTLFMSGRWKGGHYEEKVDVLRLRFVDEVASALVLQAWLEGRITWRKLWRIASDHAGDFEAQAKKLP